MTYKAVVTGCNNHIELTVEGDFFDLESWVSSISSAVNRCNDDRINKLLICDYVVQDFRFEEMERLIYQLPALGLGELKTAVYIANPKRQFTNYFGEGIARRKGLNLKVFLDMDLAVNWLHEDK